VGKSTTAAWLFVALRDMGASVELCYEYVKKYAYQNRPIEGPMQMKCFGKQVEVESEPLRAGVDVVVTDSPLLLQCYYSRSRGETFWKDMLAQTQWIDERWPSFNVFLDRAGIPYDPKGRYQTHAEAVRVDGEMLDFLEGRGVPFAVVKTVERKVLLGTVAERLGLSSRLPGVVVQQ
jgi:hypothetical protein